MKPFHFHFFSSVAVVALLFSAPIQATMKTKGLNIGINRIKVDKPISVDFSVLVSSDTNSSPFPRSKAKVLPHVDVNYRYSNAQGHGKAHVLDSGSTLHSGDKFTVSVQARQPVYVYLFHFDSHKELNELISLSGYSNRLEAGEKLMLPAKNKHFYLDDKPGQETIHTIVSEKPLANLYQQYQQALGSKQLNHFAQVNTQLGAVTKGLKIGSDAQTQGRVLGCLAGQESCRETFVIQHR